MRPRIILLSMLCLGYASSAWAQPVTLWGIQRGCERDTDLTSAVEGKLTLNAHRVVPLERPDIAPALPSAVAEQLARACPSFQGQLLGGIVETAGGVSRYRLWLVDMSTRQIASRDNFCRNCDLAQVIPLQAAMLAENPSFGSAPAGKPSYCSGTATVSPPSSTSNSARPYVVIYGDPKPRPIIWAAVRKSLSAQNKEPLALQSESKTLPPDELRKLLGEDSAGQVIGVEVQTATRAQVWVYSEATGKSESTAVDCAGCSKEEFADRIGLAAIGLVSRCVGPQCPGNDRGGDRASNTPPVASCEPFVEPECKSKALDTPALGTSSSGGNPKLAKLALASTWGIFSASAATAIALFAANSTSAGAIPDPSGTREIQNALIGPAWTMVGVAGLSLGLAIPVTIVSRQPPSLPQRTGGLSTSNLLPIQCPQ